MKIFLILFFFLFASSCANIKFQYVPPKAKSTSAAAKTENVKNTVPPSPTQAATKSDSQNSCNENTPLICLKEAIPKFPTTPPKDLLPVLTQVCEMKTAEPAELFHKMSACFSKARILTSLGQTEEARKLRRASCFTDTSICARVLSETYTPIIFDSIDVADELCSKSLIKPGYVTKMYLDKLCFVQKSLAPQADLETEYVKYLNTQLKQYEDRILKIREENSSLPISHDFSVFDKQKLKDFQDNIRNMSFPFRVKFNLTYVFPNLNYMDFKPKTELILSTNFYAGNGDNYSDRFMGYASLTHQELFTLAKKFPFMKSAVTIPATGIVVGYRETGVVPVPLIVLDPISN